MSIPAIVNRLKSHVPALGLRVEEIANFAVLMAGNVLPTNTPCAFVIPLGVNAAKADRSAGVHLQMLTVTYGVMLVITFSGDETGGDSAGELSSIASDIRQALCGAPNIADGSLSLVRERLERLVDGTAFWQLDFSTQEQLRVFT